MSIEIRRAADIFRASGGWYEAGWHFSFSYYRDDERMGLGPLPVVNDDVLVPGGVWPMHPHADVESLTYVIEGRFGHADSLGNGGELGPGGAQVMSFGPGMAEHSERNLDPDRPLRFLQFWILPDRANLDDAVQQHQFRTEEREDRWLTIMGPHGEAGLDLHQDARVSVARLHVQRSLDLLSAPGRGAYLLVLDGEVAISSSAGADTLVAGDAVIVRDMESVALVGIAPTSELWVAQVPLEAERHGIWAQLAE